GALLFAPDATATEKRLAQHTNDLIKRNRTTLLKHRPKTTRCSSGYNLFQVLPLETPLPGEEGFSQEQHPLSESRLPVRTEAGSFAIGNPRILDMPRLFCGSEGSLGVLIEAK